MKRYMKNQLSGVLAVICAALAIAAQFLFGARSAYLAAANTYDAVVLAHGPTLTRTNDVAITARHLLWADGATPGTTVALATATTPALGTIDNITTSTGIIQTVLMLDRNQTKKMVASEAMATVGVRVYQAAGGKIALNGVLCVGILRSTAGADGDIVEVDDTLPRVDPNGSNTVAGGTLAIPVTRRHVSKTTGGVEALTLADGLPGQLLTITLVSAGGTGTITPTTKTGFSTIALGTIRDSITLVFVDPTTGWVIVGKNDASADPVVA